jgi:hypothetical protein
MTAIDPEERPERIQTVTTQEINFKNVYSQTIQELQNIWSKTEGYVKKGLSTESKITEKLPEGPQAASSGICRNQNIIANSRTGRNLNSRTAASSGIGRKNYSPSAASSGIGRKNYSPSAASSGIGRNNYSPRAASSRWKEQLLTQCRQFRDWKDQLLT